MANRTRAAVDFVQANMKPGTKIRNVKTGQLYFIGARFRMSDFWVMRLDAPEKGLLHAITLKASFEPVKEEAHA